MGSYQKYEPEYVCPDISGMSPDMCSDITGISVGTKLTQRTIVALIRSHHLDQKGTNVKILYLFELEYAAIPIMEGGKGRFGV